MLKDDYFKLLKGLRIDLDGFWDNGSRKAYLCFHSCTAPIIIILYETSETCDYFASYTAPTGISQSETQVLICRSCIIHKLTHYPKIRLLTYGWTFVNVELLLQLKKKENFRGIE